MRSLISSACNELFEKSAVDASTNSISNIIGLRGGNDFVKSFDCNEKWIKSYNA